MDKLFSAGKEFLEGQGGGQSNQAGGYKAPDRRDDDDDGLQDAHREASRLAGPSASSDLFAKVVGALGQRKEQLAGQDVDEEDVARKHAQAYRDGSHGDEDSLGAAAAMQALKTLAQNNGGGGGGSSGMGGQGAFLAVAMSEASKLFDKAAQGKVPEGASKESVIQKAGEMAMKMYFKNQAKQQGGLMGMASQFFK